MRKQTIDRTLASTTRAGLLLSGIGLLLVSPTFGEGLNTNVTEIFQNAESKLSQEYTRLISESEAAQAGGGACCEDSCDGSSSCGSCSSCGHGCDSCCLGEPYKLHDSIFGECSDSAIDIGGWMQWGYHSDNNGLFNNHANDVNMHQLWLYAEKTADGSCGWDWGFRGDLVYGVDAQDTQAFGNPAGSWDFSNGWDHGIYGWAMPQLYFELANGPWSIKAGHFFTLVGYEVVAAPDNFFYSHAFTMFNSEPFTHTGAIATYQAADGVEVYAGWTAGWDTGFDSFNDGSNFLGGAAIELNDSTSFTYITTIGDFGRRGEGYSHSVVVDHNINDCWEYVFQSDLVETNGGGDHQFGVNQYLFYTINDCLKAGGRMEWWKNGSDSVYAFTAGLNIKPRANLVVRPEIRHQWAGNDTAVNAAGFPVDETIFGVDAILTF